MMTVCCFCGLRFRVLKREYPLWKAGALPINWVKRNKKKDTYFMGLGFWTRSNSEVCLIGTKGHPKRVSKAVPQVCDARVMEHSRKPSEIRDRIVELCGDVPRIELFARETVKGWDCLGDEIDGEDIRDALVEVINDEC